VLSAVNGSDSPATSTTLAVMPSLKDLMMHADKLVRTAEFLKLLFLKLPAFRGWLLSGK